MRGWSRLIAVVGVLAIAPAALGQGSVSDGSVTFGWSSFGGPASGSDFMVGGYDHSFQTDWFYRLAGDSAETRYGAPFTQSYSGNTATHGYTFPGYLATIETIVSEQGLNHGEVTQTLTITNIGATTLNLTIFHYQDVDLHGTFNNDSATGDINSITVTDASSVDEAEYSATGPDAYQVAGHPALRDSLTDGGITNLDNSGLPFGSGDLAAALQWDLSVPIGGQTSVSVTLGVIGNQSACQPDSGSCNEANGSPGCDDSSCCTAVCAQDPGCCDVVWDQNCADAAAILCAEDCSEDTNGDNQVNVSDLINIIIDWGCSGVCVGDVNGDNQVNVQDLVDVIIAWGNCP